MTVPAGSSVSCLYFSRLFFCVLADATVGCLNVILLMKDRGVIASHDQCIVDFARGPTSSSPFWDGTHLSEFVAMWRSSAVDDLAPLTAFAAPVDKMPAPTRRETKQSL